MAPLSPALAQEWTPTIVGTEGFHTSVEGWEGNYYISSGIHQGNTAVNVFDRFQLGRGEHATLSAGEATRLVNIMAGNEGVRIDGSVVANSWVTENGVDVYFVTPGGFVLGEHGQINVGALTVSTSSNEFRNALVDAARGENFEDAAADLFAGREALNPNGQIEILGRLEARRLNLRAGARLVLDGQITVGRNTEGGDGGYISPAVNVDDQDKAVGAAVGPDGTIRLLSGGDVQIGNAQNRANSLRAQSSNDRSTIEVTAAGDIRVEGSNSAIIAAASEDDKPGLIVMLAEGTASIADAIEITAEGAPGANGELSIEGRDVVIDGVASLGGAGSDVTVKGKRKATLRGTTRTKGATTLITAEEVAFQAGELTTESGHVLVSGRKITATDVTIDTTGADSSGAIFLRAEADASGSDWPISVKNVEAEVSLNRATLTGGAIVVTAVARSGNVDPEEDAADQAAFAEGVMTKAEDSQSGGFDLIDTLADLMGSAVEAAGGGPIGAAQIAAGQLPLNVPVSLVDAKVIIKDSDLTADGRLAEAPRALIPGPRSSGEGAPLSSTPKTTGLGKDGLETSAWALSAGSKDYAFNLPKGWAADQGIYLQSHAENEVSVAPSSLAPAIGVAVMDTRSRLEVTGASTLDATGNVSAFSTVHEKFAAEVSGGKVSDVSAAVLVSYQNVENQLLIDAESIRAGGYADFAALTQRSHEASVGADAGRKGFIAVAVNLGISQSRTEAAVNARSGLRSSAAYVTAATTYAANTRSTSAEMGMDDPGDLLAVVKEQYVSKITDPLKNLVNRILLKPHEPEEQPQKKDTMGLGLAIDVNVMNDDTRASLGGSFHDRDTGRRVDFAPGRVETTGAVEVAASLAYLPEEDRILNGPRRSVTANMGSVGSIMQAKLDAMNKVLEALPGTTPVTAKDLQGTHDTVLMGAAAVSLLGGTTEAEIGGKIDAASVAVNALTDYSAPLESAFSLQQELVKVADYIAKTSSTEGVEEGEGTGGEDKPEMPDLKAILTNLGDLNSTVSAKAGRSTLANDDPLALAGEIDEGQQLAAGLSVNMFSTQHATRAAIRDGAQITTSGAVDVNAFDRGILLHATNFPPDPTVLASGQSASAVGGTINVVRRSAKTTAEIGAATVTAGGLKLDAASEGYQGLMHFAGGGAAGNAINVAFGGGIMTNDTMAKIGAGAHIDLTGAAAVSATDKSGSWAVAGGLSKGTGAAVGGSLAVNFATRNTTALVGTGAYLVSRNGGVSITAKDESVDIAAAIAGSAKTAEKPKPDAWSKPEDEDDLIDMIVNPLLGEDEQQFMTTFLAFGTDASDEVDSQKTGLAVAGAAALNLMLGNDTKVEIGAGATVSGFDDVTALAQSNAVIVGVTGAVALGLDPTQDTNAIAGSLNWTQGHRNVLTQVSGSMTSQNGDLSLAALDDSSVVNIAVGGAGTSRGEMVIAGSVAGNMLHGQTGVRVSEATLKARNVLSLEARDRALQLAIGGGIGLNFGDGTGMGIGVATNTYDRETFVSTSRGSLLEAAFVNASADFRSRIFGLGISAGVGKTGIAGSVTVNNILAGAKVDLSGTFRTQVLNAASREHGEIWTIAGAVALSTGNTAVGAAAAINTVVTESGISVEDAVFEDTGAPTDIALEGRATTKIRSLAAAGALSQGGVAVGAGVTVNTVVASNRVKIEDSTVANGGDIAVNAKSERDIAALGGGAAGSAQGSAAGAGLAVNVIAGNDTDARIVGGNITAESLALEALAASRIRALAAGLGGGGGGAAIAGSVTVNVIDGLTRANIEGGTQQVGGTIAQVAKDQSRIDSLAGSVAAGNAGFGLATSVNIIAQDTEALSDSTFTGDLTLSAQNRAEINALAAAAAGGGTAAGLSAAVGDIGNTSRAILGGSNRAMGDVSIEAVNDSQISILSGTAAGGGGAGVGAAVTLAMIHDGALAQIQPGVLSSAGDVSVNALRRGKIDALAASGAAGGSAGIAGSIVFTMIGRDASIDGLDTALEKQGNEDPVASAQAQSNAASTQVMGDLQGQVAAAGSADLNARVAQGFAKADDQTRADVVLGAGTYGNISVTARDESAIRSLAGGAAVGGAAGLATGVTVNLMLGATSSRLALAAGAGPFTAGDVRVAAIQSSSIQTAAFAAGGGAGVGGGAAVSVNVMQRDLLAEIAGNGNRLTAAGDVAVEARQNGPDGAASQITNAVGVAAVGGVAAGGAIAVNYANDRVRAQSQALDLTSAGDVAIVADSRLNLTGNAAALSAGGTSFSGNFVVNVATGSVQTATTDLSLRAQHLTLTAEAQRKLVTNAGGLSVGGVAVGASVAVNVNSLKVGSRHAGLAASVSRDALIASLADTSFGGVVVQGAAALNAAVAGSATANRNLAEVTTALSSTTGRDPLVLAGGNLALRSNSAARVTSTGGADAPQSVNSAVAVGLVGAGVSVTVNLLKANVKTEVSRGALLAGLGLTAARADLGMGSTRGVAISADSDTFIAGGTYNLGAGLVGISAVTSTVVVEDRARVELGRNATAGESADVLINEGLDADLGAMVAAFNGGNYEADAAQDLSIRAQTKADVSTDTVALSFGGIAGVGAAVSVTTLGSTAEVLSSGGVYGAAGNVSIDAESIGAVSGDTLGTGGGFVGMAATTAVHMLEGKARVDLGGAAVSAQGDIAITAQTDMTSKGSVGSVAGGIVAGVGAVRVTNNTSEAEVLLGDAVIAAEGDVTLAAGNDLTLEARANSGSVGLFAAGVATNVVLAETKTKVDLAEGGQITAGADLQVRSHNDTSITTQAGVLAASGLASVGAGLDVHRFASEAMINFGANTTTNVGGAAQLSVRDARDISSTVVSGAAGGLAGISAAISALEVAGASTSANEKTGKDDRATLLASAQDAVSADNLEGGRDAKANAGLVGGAGDQAASHNKVAALDITGTKGTAQDIRGIAFGDGAALTTVGDLSLTAENHTVVNQLTGAAGAGYGAGLASGLGLVFNKSGAEIALGDNVELRSGAELTLSATDGGAIRSDAYTIAASGVVGVGTGTVRVESAGAADIVMGQNVSISSTGSTDVSASRNLPVDIEVVNATMSGVYGAGASVARLIDSGRASVSMAGGSISAADLTVTAENTSRNRASAVASTGGVFGAGSGVDTRVKDSSKSLLTLEGVSLSGDNITLEAKANPNAEATSKGNTVAGGVAVGVSLAEATVAAEVKTKVTGTVVAAGDLTIAAEMTKGGAKALANGSAGGLLAAGVGARAEAYGDYTVSTTLAGSMSAGGDLKVRALADEFSMEARGIGKAGALLAIGAVVTKAGQSEGKAASVLTDIAALQAQDALSALGSLSVEAVNNPLYRTTVESGAYGLAFTGAAAQAETRANLVTKSSFGVTGPTLAIAAEEVDLSTVTGAKLESYVDSRSASLVGASGAKQKTEIALDQGATLGGEAGGVTIVGDAVSVRSEAGVDRGLVAGREHNLRAGSGGLVGVSAASSEVNVSRFKNAVTLDENSFLTSLDGQQVLRVAAISNLNLLDRLYLDANGAVAVPHADGKMKVAGVDTRVDLKDALLHSAGDMRVTAGTNSDLQIMSNANSTGLAAAASAFADIDLTANQTITVAGETQMRADRSLEVLAGYVDAQQSTTVLAESRVYNKTALPIKTNPKADASAKGSSVLSIGEAASLSAINDVSLGGVAGSRNVKGYGEGTDAYREVLAEIANFFGGLFGAEPVSLKIKTGTSSDTAMGSMVVNGTIRAGVQSTQALIFDAQNQLNLALGGYSADQQAVTTTPVIRTGQAASAVLKNRVAALQQARKSSSLTAADKVAIDSELGRLNSEILRVERDSTAQLIEVGDIRASAGNIQLYGDAMSGSGTLTAPGVAKIDIQSRSGAILAVGNMLIDDHAGGAITFNDVRVRTNRDIQQLTNGRSAALATTLVSTEAVDARYEMLLTSSLNGKGSVIFTGDAVNLRGLIKATAPSNVSIYGSLLADTIDTGHSETVDLGWIPGTRHVNASAPETDYSAIAKRLTGMNTLLRTVGHGGKTAGSGNLSQKLTLSVQDTLAQAGKKGGSFFSFGTKTEGFDKGVSAGRTLYISAEQININGTISAGKGGGNITISQAVDEILAGITDTKEVQIWDGTTRSTTYKALEGKISSDVSLYWDPVKQKIRMADIEVVGGNIEITGDIFSTGYGKIEVLDGYSSINVDSKSSKAIDFGRVVAAGSLDAYGNVLGVNGRIVLNDLTSSGGVKTTVYERKLVNGQASMIVSEGTRSAAQVDAGAALTLSQISSSTANGGRTASYQVKTGRDYLWSQQQSYTRDYVNRRDVQVVAAGKEKTKRHYEATEKSKITFGDLVTTSSGLTSRPSGATYGSVTSTWTEGERLQSVSGEKRVYNNVKLGVGWRHYDSTYRFTGTQKFETRVKADHAVAISFTGADSGGVSLASIGDINLTGEVLSAGAANLLSHQGSIYSANSQGLVNGLSVSLSALQGQIGTTGMGVQIVQSGNAASRVSATARDAIHLEAARGGLVVDQLSTTATSYLGGAKGEISVKARGDITGYGTSGLISGNDMTLRSSAGAITGLKLNQTGIGALTASALGDVNLTAPNGNLAVREVVSSLGNVSLSVPKGRIFDANDDSLQDFRTTDELKEQWSSLIGLTNEESERFNGLVEQFATDREQLAQAYWQARTANGGVPVAYALSVEERAALVEAGNSEQQIQGLENERAAFWASFDGQDAPEEGYRYDVSQAEREKLKSEALWSEEVLLTNLPAAMVRRYTSNVTENEAPNIRAFGNITLNAMTGIGRNDVDYVIDTNAPLTQEAMDKLAAALTTDVVIDKENGTISLRQFDDFNILHTGLGVDGRVTGVLSAKVSDPIANIFLSSAGEVKVAALEGARNVLRAEGDILNAGTGIVAKGIDLVLQSGKGSIGSAEQALRTQMTGEHNLRAGTGINLSAEGDIKVSEVYTPGKVVLSATNQILDTLLTGAPRIVAGSIILSAADIGGASGIGIEGLDADSTLELRATHNSRVRAENLTVSGVQTSGVLHVEGIGRLELGEITLATGQIELHHDEALNLLGAKLKAGSVLVTSGGVVAGLSGEVFADSEAVSVYALGGSVTGEGLAMSQTARLRLYASQDIDLDLASVGQIEAAVAGGNVGLSGATGLNIGVIGAQGGQVDLTSGGPVRIGLAGVGVFAMPALPAAGTEALTLELAPLDRVSIQAEGATVDAGLIVAGDLDVTAGNLQAQLMAKGGVLNLNLDTTRATILHLAGQDVGAVTTGAEQSAALSALDLQLRDSSRLTAGRLAGERIDLKSQGQGLRLAGLDVAGELYVEQGDYAALIFGSEPSADLPIAEGVQEYVQIADAAALTLNDDGSVETKGIRRREDEVDPTLPTEPSEPTEPTFPTEPSEPTEPTFPTEPSEPTDPTFPTEPSEPTDPTFPTEPSEPTDPTFPTEPSEPTVTPEQQQNAVNSVKPTERPSTGGKSTDWNTFSSSLSEIPLTLANGAVLHTARQTAALEALASVQERINQLTERLATAGSVERLQLLVTLSVLQAELAKAEAEVAAADADARLTPEERASQAEAARLAEAQAEAQRAAAEAAEREARQKADSERAAAERAELERKQAEERVEIARQEAAERARQEAAAEAARQAAIKAADLQKQRDAINTKIADVEAKMKNFKPALFKAINPKYWQLQRELSALKTDLAKVK